MSNTNDSIDRVYYINSYGLFSVRVRKTYGGFFAMLLEDNTWFGKKGQTIRVNNYAFTIDESLDKYTKNLNSEINQALQNIKCLYDEKKLAEQRVKDYKCQHPKQ